MRVRVLVAAIAMAAVFAGTAQAAQRYTALGDSFAAGPLIPNPLAPLGCLKSSNNYGRIAQRTLDFAEYRDATCSGARTERMTATQNVSPGPNPPELDSLSADTRLVTLTIGGNGIGFSDLAQDCVSVLPFGSPCRDRYTSGGDQITARINAPAPRSPPSCRASTRTRRSRRRCWWPTTRRSSRTAATAAGRGCPCGAGDMRWLRKHVQLNAMLAQQAEAANGATIVDVYKRPAWAATRA